MTPANQIEQSKSVKFSHTETETDVTITHNISQSYWTVEYCGNIQANFITIIMWVHISISLQTFIWWILPKGGFLVLIGIEIL